MSWSQKISSVGYRSVANHAGIPTSQARHCRDLKCPLNIETGQANRVMTKRAFGAPSDRFPAKTAQRLAPKGCATTAVGRLDASARRTRNGTTADCGVAEGQSARFTEKHDALKNARSSPIA